MPRAATEVMQSILFSAVLDAIAALKAASRGMPNQLVRDLQAIHPNITFADLPKELQDAIVSNTRAAFSQLLKEGYAVGPRDQMAPARPPLRHPPGDRRGPPPDRRPRPNGPPKGPEGKGPGKGPGQGPGKGPGAGPRRPRPTKGKPRLS